MANTEALITAQNFALASAIGHPGTWD